MGEDENSEPGDLIYRRPRHAWEPGGKWVRLREVAPGFRPTPNLVIARRA